MLYKTYGSTGIKLSTIGFGGMRFDDSKGLEDCAQLVINAYNKDINYFDTAPLYVNDKSEIIMGLALKQMLKTRTQKPFYVSTKSSKAEPSQVRQNIETSLERLGLDYIDFYHFWCIITMEEYELRKTKGVLKEFEKLKDEGLIKHISVSTHVTGKDVALILNDYPFDGILLGYSVMNFPYREEGIQAAAKLNKGVVVMNPLGGGMIPQNPDRFDFVKTQPDENVTEAALKFLINDDRITVSLVGFTTNDHLEQAIKAVDEFKPIPKQKIDQIKTDINQSLNELCTSCGYCDDCPQEIPIPKLMDIYNHFKLGETEQEIMNRIRWHWGLELEENYADKCTQCGECEAKCTQKLPICQAIKYVQDRVQKYLEKQPAKSE